MCEVSRLGDAEADRDRVRLGVLVQQATATGSEDVEDICGIVVSSLAHQLFSILPIADHGLAYRCTGLAHFWTTVGDILPTLMTCNSHLEDVASRYKVIFCSFLAHIGMPSRGRLSRREVCRSVSGGL